MPQLLDAAPYIEESIGNLTGVFSLVSYSARGMLIRAGRTNEECLGNLSWVLDNLNPLSAAEYNGAASGLTLLPTAGALIGAPAKELWIVYKLMPVAGVLTMCLSLGGTIMPSQAGQYDPKGAFDFGGILVSDRKARKEYAKLDEETKHNGQAQLFAEKVRERADDQRGANYGKIWLAVVMLLAFNVQIVVILWYAERGAVIPWWCSFYGWMLIWYFLLTVSCLIDNTASNPFYQTWTIRVSRAPEIMEISDRCPLLVTDSIEDDGAIIQNLRKGYNVDSRVVIPHSRSYAKSRVCFYVVVPQTGTSRWRAALRIFSRGSNIASFAFGTTLFASSQLLSVSLALITIICTMVPAVLGRVLSMWIALEMNKHNKAILHAVVPTHLEASKYLNAILKQKGLVFETQGHIVVDGRVICRYNQWFSWSRYVGLLAPPFNIIKKATSGYMTAVTAMPADGEPLSGPPGSSMKKSATVRTTSAETLINGQTGLEPSV
ncbi:hypothetical protein EPUS_01369 [Endocarpon pusillum Z07020]|uniref:Uncharacterized protein n=1 Tax=Endocarpon pusillum (strain Z07020 / HMAS-L-300199) TaxID=1263415 RepID=U1GVF3_ENDPU|nr:uncharacterized protein EPUS_01369 [Endocarpon pusillum Z07020]ERF76036.1 hypothetical protein EPUS_01369 [Endocarpon pusillum Z07020]